MGQNTVHLGTYSTSYKFAWVCLGSLDRLHDWTQSGLPSTPPTPSLQQDKCTCPFAQRGTRTGHAIRTALLSGVWEPHDIAYRKTQPRSLVVTGSSRTMVMVPQGATCTAGWRPLGVVWFVAAVLLGVVPCAHAQGEPCASPVPLRVRDFASLSLWRTHTFPCSARREPLPGGRPGQLGAHSPAPRCQREHHPRQRVPRARFLSLTLSVTLSLPCVCVCVCVCVCILPPCSPVRGQRQDQRRHGKTQNRAVFFAPQTSTTWHLSTTRRRPQAAVRPGIYAATLWTSASTGVWKQPAAVAFHTYQTRTPRETHCPTCASWSHAPRTRAIQKATLEKHGQRTGAPI